MPPSPPRLLTVGCSNMVSLCGAGSGGGCVGLLWAVDAQRGQCSLAVRAAERLPVPEPGRRSTCKLNQLRHIVGLQRGDASAGWNFFKTAFFVIGV